MAIRSKHASRRHAREGNFVSEWFGHRIYPSIADSRRALNDQQRERCPFLSEITETEQACIKSESSRGVCTISSASNGVRQDWLVCPYRAIDVEIFSTGARRLFGLDAGTECLVVAAPSLAQGTVRKRVLAKLESHGSVIAFLQARIGGEISLSATDRSPELSFDTTLVQLARSADGDCIANRYAFLEIQTMDFHGTYRNAVKNLKDALRLHRSEFSRTVGENQQWLSDRIEGPNIANVFKRTFYQIMLKFQIGAHSSCSGAAIAIPASVWDSWQRHLGRPELRRLPDGILLMNRGEPDSSSRKSWIYVFDVIEGSSPTPNRLVIKQTIATDVESLAHYAFTVAPEAAIEQSGSFDHLLATVRQRLATWWPELGAIS